jgi:ribosomal protein L14
MCIRVLGGSFKQSANIGDIIAVVKQAKHAAKKIR